MHAQSSLTFFDTMDCSHQAPLFKEFSRQEYWNGLPFPSPGDLLTQGSNPSLLRYVYWQADSLPIVPPGMPRRGSCTEEKPEHLGVKGLQQ